MSLDQTSSSGHNRGPSGAQNGSHVEQLPSQEQKVPMTITAVGNAIDYKIVAKPKEELKSPSLVKRHLFLKRPDPTILDELYRLTTDMNHSETSIWASSKEPFPIRLSHATIKKSVEQGKMMDGTCLDIAIRNMAREDAENFMNTKCLGWRHYVDSNWMQSTNVTMRIAYCREATLYDPSGSHLVLIPVPEAGEWTLYAFDMCEKKLSILDSRRDTSEGGDEDPARRHEETRKAVCAALDKTMDVDFSFLSWDYEFPKVPRQQNSCDSGFFVFNFMRLWDSLDSLYSILFFETMELRKNFLAYILSNTNEHHPDIPANVSELIKRLPGDTTMDLELLKAANAGNIDAFCKLIDPERSAQASIDHASININHQPAFCSCLCYCFHFKCTSSRRSDEQANQIMQSLAKSTSSTDIANTCPLIWQVTADGSGVLHIAASFGDVKPVEAILTPQQNRGIAAALLRAKNNRGDRPLHQAASTGSRETTERIVEKAKEIMGESDANFVWFLRARNLDGQTCLHEAVRLGHKDVVEYLAQEDARLGVERPSREVAQPLVQSVDNEGISPLYLATTLLKEEIINALLLESVASMISPSYSGPAGKTALHAAVPLSKELSSILVNWKPSLIRIPDESGSTPLHYLADGKYTDKPSCISITELLLSKDPSSGYCEDSKGSLPIHVAAAYNTVGVIDQFVKMCPGCELSCNASGQTILHVAVQRGSYDIVGLVCSEVRFKMILNTKDNDGNTALHLAVQKGCHKTFGFLIGNRDVSTSIRNKNGYTPLDHAVLNKTSRWTYATYWPFGD
ncbi:uncharacterized protein LOC102700458 [Oryza brachyantha]|uniref:uncharacterized protein LOC102700458 n=1 Tax=Oryza brachyantha TaxID=4533 RepID=UPI001ADB04CA|nr:uncharacterized protein LOC102700458 [Oryza brachyantha]